MIHSQLKPNRLTLIFMHGLGDSHLSYLPYLYSDLAEHYNILIPDLLGHGKSSNAADYSFEHQVQGVEAHCCFIQNRFNLEFSDIVLIAHSMGGIHATLLCESKFKNHIKAFVNAEGSITQFGSFIASNMVSSIKTQRFEDWLSGFKQQVYEKLSFQHPFIRSYYASLEFCQPDAFLQNAKQMYEMSRSLEGTYTHLIGKKYAELHIPTIYCYGDSLAVENINFLNSHQLTFKHFPCQTHFVLSECKNLFINFMHDYLKAFN